MKHGDAVVEAGNHVMIDIEHYREGLDRFEAGEFSSGDKDAMQDGLNQAVERAAQLAIEGNTYISEVAERDPDLMRAIEEAGKKDAARPEEEKGKTPANVDATAEQQSDLRHEDAERPTNEPDAREAHELASTVDATNHLQDRVNKEREATQRGGETTRTDPAQQHIPRLEELERDEIERKERDRDDRER